MWKKDSKTGRSYYAPYCKHRFMLPHSSSRILMYLSGVKNMDFKEIPDGYGICGGIMDTVAGVKFSKALLEEIINVLPDERCLHIQPAIYPEKYNLIAIQSLFNRDNEIMK